VKTIILPGHPVLSDKPDPEFEKEYESAKKFGKVFFFNLEEFAAYDSPLLAKLPPAENPKEDIFYHGWMMNAGQYRAFYLALQEKGYRLTNVPGHHTFCNYFDSWYPHLQGLTPESIMVHDSNLWAVVDAALDFREKTKSPLIIKDAVKSLKHDWYKACFIPEHANGIEMAKIIGAFLEAKLSHHDLKKPVVIRKFESLETVGRHPKSGMPLSHEYRTYVYQGKVLLQAPYWEVDYPKKVEPDPKFIEMLIKEIGSKCGSQLYTIDTALKTDGSWTVIEIGDGQVSMLPDRADKDEFFRKLLGEQ
jgi:hypothetical protein